MKVIWIAILWVCLFGFSANLFAQTPQSFNYQAVARDAAGLPLVNSFVGVRASVVDNSANGAVVFSERHVPQSNAGGVFSLAIGQGQLISGSFAAIDWSTGAKWLRIEIDPAGGANYTINGAQQLLSVPYALFAAETNNATNIPTYSAGTGITVSGGLITNIGDVNAADDVTLSTPISGDLSGLLPSPSVVRLQGRSVANVAPVTGEVLQWNGTQWVPANVGLNIVAGTGIGITGNVISNAGDTNASDDITNTTILSGDLAGSLPAPLVDGIQGRAVANTAPASGEVLKWNGSAWAPAADNDNLVAYIAGPGIGISGNVISNTGDADPTDDITGATVLGGDLSGVLPNPSVVNIRGRAVSNAAPGIGEVLKWNGSQWTPQPDLNNNNGDISDVIAGAGLSGGGTSGAVTLDANANNGLSVFNDNVQLGGTLNQNTTVDLGNFNLNFAASGGRVGIGVANPTQKLDVLGSALFTDVAASLSLVSTNTNAQTYLNLTGGGAANRWIVGAEANTFVQNPQGFSIGFMPTGGVTETRAFNIDLLGNVGIDVATPRAKLQVANGDVYVSNFNNGVILTSPNGSCFRITVDNTGALVSTPIACP